MPITIATRTEPVQQRSTERITQLLNAAAELIDENGINGLTTSDVATRSQSSVGVVYRYFPNIQSLLRALAARNMGLFTERVFDTPGDGSRTWIDSLQFAIDEYADLMRHEPGFRALGFGDVIDKRFIRADKSNNTALAEAFAGLFERTHSTRPSAELSLDLDVVMEIINALLQRSFLYERNGDERILNRLRSIVKQHLAPHAVASSG